VRDEVEAGKEEYKVNKVKAHLLLCRLLGYRPHQNDSWKQTFWGFEGTVKAVQSCPTLVVPWTVAHQAPLSMEFSRQEYWSSCHAFIQGIFLTHGSHPGILHCRQILYHLSH